MIWSIQVLRFVAALMVVYAHASYAAFFATGSIGIVPPRLVATGLNGVDIFFVISGLVIAKVAPGRTPSEFIWARIRRIVPLYFLLSAPIIAMLIWFGNFGWRVAVASFLFWPATDKMVGPALDVGWSLCFEMLFYACAALVLAGRGWMPIVICVYGTALLIGPTNPPLQFLGNPIILEFLLGVVIAYVPNRRLGLWALPLGAICLVGANLSGIVPTHPSLAGDGGIQRFLLIGIPSAMIVYGCLQIKAREGMWTYLGGASFSIYLSHTFIIYPSVLFWRKFPISPDLIIFIGTSVSLLFAWRVHERIERPIMALLKRRKHRRRQTMA